MPSSAPANPYIAGPPLTGETGFFGREEIIQEVEHTLRYPNRNSVILYGQRRIGKTSLLLQLERRLPNPPFFPVYIDLADKALLPLGQVLHHMAVTAAEKAKIPTPALADFENKPDTFHETFLPALYQALGSERRPIFLLDEFEALDMPLEEIDESTAVRSLNRYLYKLLTIQNDSDFIFAAGRRMAELSGVTQSRFKPDLARFVSVLRPDEARALILQNGAPGIPRYDEAAIERMLALTRGHPYLLQLLCQRLYERAIARSSKNPQVSVADVNTVLPDLLAADKTGLPSVWDSLPPPERITLAALASKTGEDDDLNQAELDQAISQAGVPAETAGLRQAPENLVNWQVLEQSGQDYRFFVALMQRWTAQERPLEQVKKDELARLGRRTKAQPQKHKAKAETVAATTTATEPSQPVQSRRRLWLIVAAGLLLLLLLLCWGGGYNPFGLNLTVATATSAANGGNTPGVASISPTAMAAGETTEATEETEATPTTVEPTLTPTLATPTATIETAGDETNVNETPEAQTTPESEPTPSPTPLSGQIRVVGSTTMQPVIERLAIAFSAQSPDIQIVIQDGGSQAGLGAVQQGVADVGLVSRELTAEELANLRLFTVTPTDPVVLIVHPLVRLDTLSPGQVRDIFSGAITNWSEVGGPDAPVRVVSRVEGSGTRTTFEQIIMGQPGLITAEAIEEETNQAVRRMVASRPYAIGFVSLHTALAEPTAPPGSPNWAVLDNELLGVDILALDGVAPTLENAQNNAYPLTRPLNIVVQDPLNPLIQEWFNFITSPAGQRIIAEASQ